MTITIGWWLIPLILTLLILFLIPEAKDRGGYGAGMESLFYGTLALVGILFVWLAWAIFKMLII